ncbi:MAG: hypothetical protein E3J83_03520 [Candidatus Atribacteria bacterium]|nr:MAG: hypothetical protein E3J83_03520 [Candidatus Atribacteria bacterium]
MIEIKQEEIDQLKEDLEIANLQLQAANDTLDGNITSKNMASFRNTYVINAQDSLDTTYPMYVYFNVLDETIKIVSVKVSYWIHKYRAYSKAGASGGGQTSSSGGSSTPTTSSGGGQTTSSGGGQTTSSGGAITPTTSVSGGTIYPVLSTSVWQQADNVGDQNRQGLIAGISGNVINLPGTSHTHTVSIGNHTHTVSNHTHTVANHTHTVTIANHTHTVSNHTHTAVYGIFEEDTTPIITFSVSQDGGVGYGEEYGKVAIDRLLIDITESITTKGSKIIKFESTTRTRLTVQVEIKLDIKVR